MKNNPAVIATCLLCIFSMKTQGKPQITKLFPVQEIIAYGQQLNETGPLDKLFGKLRATYNFVFHKVDNTSNVEKILANNADPGLEALKSIWSKQEDASVVGDKEADNVPGTKVKFTEDEERIDENPTTKDWFDEIEPLAPLGSLELQDEANEMNTNDVEIIMPGGPTFQLPAVLGRHFIDWFGSLLGFTYGVYAKLSKAINQTD
ncbi:uncharacterized protein [Prorops nasuta]|uniref:uncharacterized protein n=1 Tax=Prorops nasuta TaxID=863751 RepID=UPI0034CF48E0